MREHVIRVRGRVATCQDRSFVQGTVSADRVSLDLDDEWVGLTCTVTFVSASDNITPPMSDDGTWLVPHEMTDAVAPFGVLVEGSDGTQLVKSARMERPLLVYPSDSSDGSGPTEPTLTEWRQAYELALSARCERVVATTLPSGSEATAEFGDHVLSIGVPRGERGLQGAQGPQGVKGDPFTYDDFTQAQILELQRPATEAAALANQAVTDAKTAIAEVKATEAKLYPAAENVLKGTVKDAFVHVDDAFAGAALREIAVEGACKQDGTPSPDNPVPIEVIENPVVKVQGRNFIEAAVTPGNKKAFAIALLAEADIKPSENYVLSFDAKAEGNEYYLNENLFTYKTFVVKRGRNSIPCSTVADVNKSNNSQFNPGPELKGWIVLKNKKAQENEVQFSNVQLELGSASSDYVPHASQSQPFILPAEHPYLAKLPNGTSDEIVVDRDGNVELVAMVGVNKDVRELGRDFAQGKYYSLATGLKPFESPNADYNAPVMCSAIKSEYYATDRQGIYRTWTGIYVADASGRTKEEIQAEVDRNAPLTVVAAIPETRYQLGKIEVPSLPDSTSNVWTDAEVTPRTGIEYVRDVNIVVSNLESAIASIAEG